jgi:hypothetical protein
VNGVIVGFAFWAKIGIGSDALPNSALLRHSRPLLQCLAIRVCEAETLEAHAAWTSEWIKAQAVNEPGIIEFDG